MFGHDCISLLCRHFLFFVMFIILLIQISEKGFSSKITSHSSEPYFKTIGKILLLALLDTIIFVVLLILSFYIVTYICGG